jgi:hypothetical protein
MGADRRPQLPAGLVEEGKVDVLAGGRRDNVRGGDELNKPSRDSRRLDDQA